MRKKNRSWLFIARNKPPTVLFGKHAIYDGSPTLHYKESLWIKYLKDVYDRYKKPEKIIKIGYAVIMPEKAEKYFKSSKALIPGGQLSTHVNHEKIWKDFKSDWKKNSKDNPFRLFDPNTFSTEGLDDTKAKEFFKTVQRKLKLGVSNKESDKRVVSILPDVWLYFSTEAIDEIITTNKTKLSQNKIIREGIYSELIDFATKLALDNKKR